MRFNQAALERKVDALSEENTHLRETLDKRTELLLKQSEAQQKMLGILIEKFSENEKTTDQVVFKRTSSAFF